MGPEYSRVVRFGLFWFILTGFTVAVAGMKGAELGATMSNVDLAEQIRSGTAPLVVDVRTSWEYRRGHVPGAIHLPFQRTFSHHKLLTTAKDERVLVYCEHGPRAYIARMALQRAGFQNVVLLKGHMSRWKKSGLPMAVP